MVQNSLSSYLVNPKSYVQIPYKMFKKYLNYKITTTPTLILLSNSKYKFARNRKKVNILSFK